MENLDKDLGKGVIAGLTAGLAATYVMTKFQNLTAKLGEVLEDDEPQDPQHSAHRGTKKSARQERQGDDATVKAASAISEGVFHHELSQREKEIAGPAMHYGFGGLAGSGRGRGAGLRSRGAAARAPPSVHLRALAAHLVYGLTAETVRRQVHRLL